MLVFQRHKGLKIYLLCLFCMFYYGNIEAQEPAGQDKSQPTQQQPNQQQGQKVQEPINRELTNAPVLEIKRLEAEAPRYSIELRNVNLGDLFRVIAHDYNLNILIDEDVDGKITASFTDISLEEALEAIAEHSNLILEKKGTLLRVRPNLLTQTFVLKHIEAKKLFEVSTTATNKGEGSDSSDNQQVSGLFALLSKKGKILLVPQKNALTVIDYPENIKRVAQYLETVDHKMETRVFKLKYLKADEVVGATEKITTTTEVITPTGTQVQTTTSTTTGTASSGSSK
ncbi:MAG: hypothetical protein N2606_00860 [Candidatus Omnitrophica bacterium]|nr:hypothetical protein [Candidatus Omnitrophota bacterium]